MNLLFRNFQVEPVVEQDGTRSFPDALQTAVQSAEVDKLELLNIPASMGSAAMTLVPRSISSSASSASIIPTSTQPPQIFETINPLPSHFNHSSSHLSHGRIIHNGSHGASSNPLFEHPDPRLLHGDTYLQPISTPISTPNSGGGHAISSAVSGSNPSLYSGAIARGIEDNGMDSPTYIQLESSSGGMLQASGSYSPAGNAIYSTTPISLSGGGVIGNIGHKASIEYSDVPVDPSIYAIKSNPSSHR